MSEREEFAKLAIDGACLVTGVELSAPAHRLFMRAALQSMSFGETLGELKQLAGSGTESPAQTLSARLSIGNRPH